MAKRLTEYERLKQQGAIQNYNSSNEIQIIKNSLQQEGVRVGEIEIEAYLKSHGSKSIDVVKYFKNLYGPNTGVNRGQQETTFSKTSTSTSLSSISNPVDEKELILISVGSLPSFTINKNGIQDLKSLEYDSIRVKAKQAFEEEMVKKSRDRESQTVDYFKGLLKNQNLNRYDIINFLNSGLEKTTKESGIINDKMINIEYASRLIIDKLSGNLKYVEDPDKAINQREKDFSALISIMQDGVVNAKQFSGLVYALTNNTKLSEDAQKSQTQQAARSGKTINELLAILNLESAYEKMTNTFNSKEMGIKPTIRSAGSEAIEAFKKRTENIKTSKELMKEAERFTKELIIEVENKKEKYTFLSIGQKFASSGGSKEAQESLHVADLIWEPKNFRKMYVDIKMGGGGAGAKSTRYTMAGALKTSIDEIYSSSVLDQETKNDFIIKLNLILNYMYYQISRSSFNSAENGSEKIAKVLENKKVTLLLTYVLLSSNVFISYYRKVFDSGEFLQADWLLTLKGYVWYSDFFQVVSNAIFNEGSASKVSIQQKYAFQDPSKVHDEKKLKKLLEKRSQSSVKEMVAFLESSGATEGEIKDFENFVRVFTTSKHINYLLDVNDIFNKVQENIKMLLNTK